ncbi:MAG: GNAT family N-acetyltransferase [Candidatus Zixiibacteriota bacterium]|nr:MAG: GNAT family N-acetyltransferase [candidate division Zixibacteria bacterium]
MEHKAKLKDGTEVVIRELTMDDLDKSIAFFKALPKEDRIFLRVDVTKPENVERRIQMIKFGKVIRLVALIGDEIVADGALELETEEWEEHIAELRLIVGRPYQRKGLGMIMAHELFAIAAAKNVEEIVVKFMEPQVAAWKVVEKLGFHKDSILHNYVKDIDGVKHDLVLMRCDLKSLWQKLDDFLSDFDWQRTR